MKLYSEMPTYCPKCGGLVLPRFVPAHSTPGEDSIYCDYAHCPGEGEWPEHLHPVCECGWFDTATRCKDYKEPT